MMNFISGVLLAFLCAFGFISLLYCLTQTFFMHQDYETFLLVPVSETDDDLEMKLYQAKAQIRQLSGGRKVNIIILDNGMNALMRQIAEKEAEKEKNVYICKVNELQKMTRYSKI